jgi:outer membrane protein OmpA-like peptidoglycan-associated protein
MTFGFCAKNLTAPKNKPNPQDFKMKKIFYFPTLVCASALLVACAANPTTTSLLDQTRNDYAVAQNNPKVPNLASLELAQAKTSLDQANSAASSSESEAAVNKLAYIAKQKIALAQEVASQRDAQAQIALSAKKRDEIRLQQRTQEADQATARAATEKLAAESARTAANQAELRTVVAQIDTAAALQQAQDAKSRAAELEAQLANLSAKKTERGIVITLGDVLFGHDKADLTGNGQITTQNLAAVLQKNPDRNVLIEGFTDSTGSSTYNVELSERRATSVRNALLQMGVAPSRVAVRGFGESFPVAGNDTNEGRQLNRRVEIILSDDTGKIAPR